MSRNIFGFQVLTNLFLFLISSQALASQTFEHAAFTAEDPYLKKRKTFAIPSNGQNSRNKKAKVTLKEQQDARSELLEVAEHLNQVERELLYEFVGWDTQIKRLMAAARVIILQPDMVKKPFVVPLIGFPGYGKTTLIQRWLTKMKWGHRFTQINLKKDTPSLPTDDLVAAGELEGERKEEIQQVILYDEIQNLMRYDDLYPENDNHDMSFGASKEERGDYERFKESAAKDLEAKRRIRDKDHLLLWNILGNGTLISDSRYNPDKYLEMFRGISLRFIKEKESLSENSKARAEFEIKFEQIKSDYKAKEEKIQGVKEQINTINEELEKNEDDQGEQKIEERKNLRKLLEKSRDELSELRSEKYKLEEKVRSFKSKVSISESNLASMKDRELQKLFADLKKDYPAMLGYHSYLPEKDLADEFLNNPEAFIQLMHEARKGIQKDKTTYFQRVIIILTGNPEESIGKITDTFSEIPENEIDPDSLRQRIVETIAPDDMQKWFRSIFGQKAGLESRLRLSAWEFIFPFSVSQWEELIERNLAHLNDSLSRDLEGMGIQTELDFDQSVNQMLYKEGVNPLQGPRGFFDVSAEVFGSFITRLKLDLITLPAKKVPSKIMVAFNRQTEQLEARSTGDVVSIDFKVGLKKKQENHASSHQSLKEKRNFIHHVAYCVAGSFYFRKFPASFSYRSSDKNEYIADLWPSEDIGNLFYKKRMLYTLLAAYAADLEYFPAFSQSSQGRAFKTLGKDHLNGIKKDLAEKRKNLELSGSESLALENITPELAKDKFFKLLDAGKMDEALIFALNEVRELLRGEKSIMRKLAFELNHKHELSADELSYIFYSNFNDLSCDWFFKSHQACSNSLREDDLFRDIFSQEAEPMELDPCEEGPLVITPQVFADKMEID